MDIIIFSIGYIVGLGIYSIWDDIVDIVKLLITRLFEKK